MSTCISCARSPTRRRSRRRSRAFANRDRPGSAGRYEVRLPLVRHGERDLVADARARERVAGHEHLRATVDDRDLAEAGHGPLDLRARRDEAAAHAAAVGLAEVPRGVLDRHCDAVADGEPALPHRAGGVAAAHVDAFRTFTHAHGDEEVAVRSVERDDDAAGRALPPLLDERELFEVEHAGADTRRMALTAVFFDVGDTLV